MSCATSAQQRNATRHIRRTSQEQTSWRNSRHLMYCDTTHPKNITGKDVLGKRSPFNVMSTTLNPEEDRYKSRQGTRSSLSPKAGLPKTSQSEAKPLWETSLHYATGEGTKETKDNRIQTWKQGGYLPFDALLQYNTHRRQYTD